MRYSGKCPKCGSQEIINNAAAFTNVPEAGHLELVVYDKPEALIFKEKKQYTLAAWICAGCGYTEFYCL